MSIDQIGEKAFHHQPSEQGGGLQLVHSADEPEHGHFTIHGEVSVERASDPVRYTLTIPENLGSTMMHYIAPGFGGFKSSSRDLRNSLTEDQDLAAISIDPLRHANYVDDLFNPQKAHADTITAVLDDIAANKTIDLIPGGTALLLSPVVLDAHSMGGEAVTRYGLEHPSDVALINYIEAVGLQPRVGLGFIPRILPTFRYDIIPPIIDGSLIQKQSPFKLGTRALRYYGSNPLRTAGEMISCMLSDVREDLMALRDEGVTLAMLYGAEDRLIPAKPAVKHAQKLVDLCRVVDDFGHLAPQAQGKQVAHHLSDITHTLLDRYPVAPATTSWTEYRK